MQKYTKQTVDADQRLRPEEANGRRAVATALPKNLIRPLPRAGTRGDAGFGYPTLPTPMARWRRDGED